MVALITIPKRHILLLSSPHLFTLVNLMTSISNLLNQTSHCHKQSQSQSEHTSIKRFYANSKRLLTSQSQLSKVLVPLVTHLVKQQMISLHRETIETKTMKVRKRFRQTHRRSKKLSRSSDSKMMSTPVFQMMQISRISQLKRMRSRDTSVTWLISIPRRCHMLPDAERKQRD